MMYIFICVNGISRSSLTLISSHLLDRSIGRSININIIHLYNIIYNNNNNNIIIYIDTSAAGQGTRINGVLKESNNKDKAHAQCTIRVCRNYTTITIVSISSDHLRIETNIYRYEMMYNLSRIGCMDLVCACVCV